MHPELGDRRDHQRYVDLLQRQVAHQFVQAGLQRLPAAAAGVGVDVLDLVGVSRPGQARALRARLFAALAPGRLGFLLRRRPARLVVAGRGHRGVPAVAGNLPPQPLQLRLQDL